MIEAKIINTEPVIIHHCVVGDVSESEALRGASEAMSVARDVLDRYG